MLLCACGSSGGAACGAGGVMAWGRGVGVGEQGREGVDVVYAQPEPMKTAEAVKERLSEIPTRLYLPSECDRELLAVAAAKLVAKHRQPILDFVNRQR